MHMCLAPDRDIKKGHGQHLPTWTTVSLLAHFLVLLLNSGGVPTRSPLQHAVLTVDLRYIPAETTTPAIAPNFEPHTEAEPREPDLRQEKAPPGVAIEKISPKVQIEQPVALDTYFGMGEVDISAEPSNEVFLRYPWIEYRQRLGGVVRVTLFINEHGGLDKVDLVEATPPGHFEEAALEAVNQLRFKPALKNGRPVKSSKAIEVVFDPSERLNHPAAM